MKKLSSIRLLRHYSSRPADSASTLLRPLHPRKKYPARRPLLLLFVLICSASVFSQTVTLDSLQRKFTELRFGVFMHFNMNTYSPGWGNGRVNPMLFNPTKLDCSQWAKAAKAAGMKYGMLTAKHHDGFTLWPSKQIPPNGQSIYTIAQSSVPTRDVVMEYVTAFRAQGLLPGIYYSMWDVANGVDTRPWSEVKTFVLGQLTELLGGTYGEIPALQIDGWLWKMGHRNIPYPEVRELIIKLQPNCLYIENYGMTSPFEQDVVFFEEPSGSYCPPTNVYAACQSPTISGTWFWDSRATSGSNLMTLSLILDHLTRLEPAWCNLQLNCPPNREGLFDTAIVNRIAQVGQAWKPTLSRPGAPPQLANVEHPLLAQTATATGSTPQNLINGKIDTWQSVNGLPQQITIDLGAAYYNIDIFGYMPKQGTAYTGNITAYTLKTSQDNVTYTTVATGTWNGQSEAYKTLLFPAARVRYLQLQVTGTVGGTYATAAEFTFGGRARVPSLTQTRVCPKAPTFKNDTRPAPMTFMAAGDKFVFPPGFSEKATSIAVYDISGKLLQKVATKKQVIDMRKDFGSSIGIYIVRIQSAEKQE